MTKSTFVIGCQFSAVTTVEEADDCLQGRGLHLDIGFGGVVTGGRFVILCLGMLLRGNLISRWGLLMSSIAVVTVLIL